MQHKWAETCYLEAVEAEVDKISLTILLTVWLIFSCAVAFFIASSMLMPGGLIHSTRANPA